MMERGQQSHHDQRPQSNSQPYDPQPSPVPRSHLSRSISYPVAAQGSYTVQIHDNSSSGSLPVSTHKEDQGLSYAGLGISVQGSDAGQSSLLPSPDSPFGAHLLSRHGAGQPSTPSFPALRSSSPASSVWSASDQGTSSSNPSGGFIPRLHKMVSDEKYQGLISWNPSGTTFYISRVPEFSATVLPLYFKHNNFSSFVRQLNMYGFHKVNKTPRGYKVAPENQVWEFSHTKFIRHRPDLLDEIKRRQGDIDYIREGDLATHVSLMQVQQSDIMKQLTTLQDQFAALVNGLEETRKRQDVQEENLKKIIEYLERQSQNSPASSQSSVRPPLQRKHSIQSTHSRRPSHITRLNLDEAIERPFSISSSQDLESVFESEPTGTTLGTPPQSSPPASQPSSSDSGQRSPVTAKPLRSATVFSTPSSINTSSALYTPASSFSSFSSVQRTQPSTASPTLRRNKSMVMPTLPSPNVTPTPAYNYPAHYTPSLTNIEPGSQVLQQEMNMRPNTSHNSQTIQPQPAQPPATYQSAAAPYTTPPRLSTIAQQQQYTTPQFQQTPLRQESYVQGAMQLASPATFTTSTSIQPFATQMQQQQQQQRRRRQNSTVTEEMDLGS